MIEVILYTILLSISPFGEGRIGIPYGIINDLNPIVAFLVGWIANLLVFPLLMFLVHAFDARLWKYRPYKNQSVRLMKRAKKGAGANIQKYGFWGLMVFVMIPLPFTGAYMGTIAAFIFKISRRKAFLAVSLGVTISCVIVAVGTYFGKMGISLM